MIKNSNFDSSKTIKEWQEWADSLPMTEEDVIEGVPEKSIEEIIREVAEEENMTEEEVREAIEKLKEFKFSVKKRDTKPKRDKSKEKAKKKQAKKSKNRNR